MTSREIISELLARRIPDRMGINEHFWPYLETGAWADDLLPGKPIEEQFNLDVRQVSWFTIPEPRPDLREVVEEQEEWIVERDGFGATFKRWKTRAGTPEHVDFACTTPQYWNQELREATLSLDVAAAGDAHDVSAKITHARRDDRFVTYGSLGIFEELRGMLGDVCMLESLLLEPAWIRDICEVMTGKYLEWYEHIFDKCGVPDGVHIYDDLGYTQAPFASPALHAELIMPYHKRLFESIHDHGAAVILHTCGDFRPHLPAIVESGADCVQTLEAKTGMNVVRLANDWKQHLCFMGNIDVRVLESGDKKAIERECREKLDGMRELRAPYVFMSDHSISPNVSPADYRYAVEVYRAHCKY